MLGKKNLRPTEKLYLQILKLQGIEYALFDADRTIEAYSTNLPQILNKSEAELAESPLEFLLDEFAGMETYLEQVRLKEVPQFKLEKVLRELSNGRSGYFTFTISPFEEGLLLLITDVSAEGHKEQELTQQRNELHLINHRFQVVRSQLDDLLRRFVAQEVAAQIDAEDAQQTATILFANLLGLRDWATEMNAQEMGELLDQTLTTAVNAIQKSDGLIDYYVGDAILGIFTVTNSGSNHALKAIKIAWQFVEAMHQLDAFDFSVGIHTGPIVLGKIGTKPNISHTALGETTKLAKYIQHNSPANTIIISAITHDLVADHITAKQLAPQTIPGQPKPLITYQVTGLRS